MEIERDFILDSSLVLYLPLYRLDGASIMSEDGYGHLCTVTGALWRPNGRCFDGDDKITLADTDVLSFGNATVDDPLTFMTWIRMVDTSSFMVFSKIDNTVREYTCGTTSSDLFYIQLFDANNVNFLYAYTSAVTAYENKFIHVAWTYDGSGLGTGISIYLNGEPQSLTLQPSGTYVAMHNTATLPWVGAAKYATPAYCNGYIGEFLAARRCYTTLEVQHNYLATKWRYR